MKIYVPEDTTFNKCYVVQSEGVIRGYDRQPANNVSYTYRDYYIDSHYIFKDNVGTWSQYATLPICLSSSDITTNYWYRNDISEIVFLFLAFVGTTWFLVSKLVKTLLKGGRVS